MQRKTEQLGGSGPVEAGQSHADEPRAEQVRVLAISGLRNALLARLARLPPWHPSAPGARGQADRRTTNRVESGPELPEPERTEPERAVGGGDEAHGSESSEGADQVPERSFWDKVPWFRELWRDHLVRWPDRPPRPDQVRPADPPGSWRGDGDRYLSPEDNVEADRQIGLLRRPEEAVTGLLTRIEHDNPHAGVLVGLDHRLKGPDRLKEKIADKLGIKGVVGPGDAVKTINDAIRYTFCFGGDDYVRGHDHVQARLESAGYRMTYRKNHWLDDPHYKGINSRWTTPDRGRFELQFHTRESFYAKEQLTHPAYRRLRQPTTTAPERRELLAFQSKVSAAVPEPADVRRVTDFKVRTPDG